MDTEQRLRQLTAEFPGTPPPDPEQLAAAVRRGRRAALVHRAGVAIAVVIGVATAGVLAPQVLDRPTAPVIAPPVVQRGGTPSPSPSPSPDADAGPVIEALPAFTDDLSAFKRAPEPTEEPPVEAAPVVAPEPAPEPEPVPAPEPKPEPVPAPEPKPEPEPTAAPKDGPAPHEGFTVAVTTTSAEYPQGTSPTIVIRACNATEQVREQTHAQAGHRYDLWIRNVDTGTWVADTTHRVYADAVETVRWEPGQCREFVETWDATSGPIGVEGGEHVPTGTYQAKLKWLGEEHGVLLDYRFSPSFWVQGPAQPTAFEGFTVTVTTDRASYGAGEEVRIKIRACNTSDQPREQTLPQDGHWYDLYVRDGAGTVVADTTWRAYDGMPKVIALPAGACETFVESWWQRAGEVRAEPVGEPVAPGTYTVKVRWLGTEHSQEYDWVHSDPFELTG